ncbi:ABC transporter ATP-binding protein [Luteimonas sp. XNQY3]|nr:ABC transporter ATP-binding protein [Luteimonas sp. XNQY3]MCD9005774.1 ABC transporter ATP-binding protein [Luteimonas sp. XNQY3]
MSARIELSNVTLQVPTFVQKDRSARSWLGMLAGAAFDPPVRRLNTLLHDVSFKVEEGDRLAILGRNGAGKSTLLRVLNKVFVPTTGTVQLKGSHQALLNIGLGFNNEATVRENVFLRGTAMGIRTAQLSVLMSPILEFAGLEEKANYRLHTLSSGQRMRLGFAISTSVQHDIILMDEWVGTGDAEFTKRAKERMQGRFQGSKIVVLASHSIGLLRDVCNKALVMERGRVVYHGDLGAGLQVYQALMSQPAPTESEAEAMAAPAGQQPAVSGVVERVHFDDAGMVVVGWALVEFQRPPGVIALDLGDGVPRPVDTLEWLSRPDVQSHFGLVDAHCGFRFRIDSPSLRSFADLKGRLHVMAGDVAEDLAAPLRVAQAVAVHLDGVTAMSSGT